MGKHRMTDEQSAKAHQDAAALKAALKVMTKGADPKSLPPEVQRAMQPGGRHRA